MPFFVQSTVKNETRNVLETTGEVDRPNRLLIKRCFKKFTVVLLIFEEDIEEIANCIYRFSFDETVMIAPGETSEKQLPSLSVLYMRAIINGDLTT